MKGGKGYFLTETLLCLAAAAAVCAASLGAYNSGVRLIAERNAAADAFNAASGAYSETELTLMGLTVTKEEFYCPGSAKPFYYITVTNADGKTAASVVAGSE